MRNSRYWKVGELARQTGVSIRTLHYYDEIGLLCPSQHTESGHRLYRKQDVIRLQQIKSLQQLGFSLEEVRDLLNRPEFSPQHILQMHVARLQKQIAQQQKLCKRLQTITHRLQSAEEISVDEFLQAIKETELMEKFEKYYTPEQLEELRQRKKIVGEERIKEVEKEWPELIAQVQADMARGTEPTSESAQALAQRWMELINEFTGGNPEILQSLKNMYQQEPHIASDQGFVYDPRMSEFIEKAYKASQKGK